mgnify:CR=1 FL=1
MPTDYTLELELDSTQIEALKMALNVLREFGYPVGRPFASIQAGQVYIKAIDAIFDKLAARDHAPEAQHTMLKEEEK